MAKVAKIFCKQHNTGSSTIYTVPINKFIIANLVTAGAGSTLAVNGDDTLTGTPISASGMVFPAGTTLQLKVTSGVGGLLTGFEYDV